MPLTADCYDCRRRRAAVAGQQLVAIVDPRAAKLVTGRHWIEDDGAARLEATEKGIVERRGDCYEFRGCGKIRSPGKIKYLRDMFAIWNLVFVQLFVYLFISERYRRASSLFVDVLCVNWYWSR